MNCFAAILLNAGIPFIFIEYPAMILALVIVITVEYYLAKKSGISFSTIVWSNIVSTLVGVPLSNVARALIANYVFKGGYATDPFESTLGLGDFEYEGSFLIVILIVLVFDYIFSVLIEFLIYQWKYKHITKSRLFKKTAFVNLISYIAITIAIPALVYGAQYLLSLFNI